MSSTAFIRDMTQKIAADEQLRQAQKMDGPSCQLNRPGVAHELSHNVLTVITGTIEISGGGGFRPARSRGHPPG